MPTLSSRTVSFNILDYLPNLDNVKSHPTWIGATCPVCSGNLKISKSQVKYGAYTCYSSDCSAYAIRNKVAPSKVFKRYSGFKSKPVSKVSQLAVVVKALPNLDIKGADYISEQVYEAPYSFTQAGNKLTYYAYSPNFRVVRVDGLELGDKFVYPQTFTMGEWVNTRPLDYTFAPVYKSNYCGKNVLLVEGEKSADAGQRNGFNAISVPGFASGSDYFWKFIATVLKELGVDKVLYLEDNDSVGKKKASTACIHLHYAGIAASSVNLAERVDKLDVKGYDLYDYLAVHSADELISTLDSI